VQDANGTANGQPDLALYLGLVTFTHKPEPGEFRLLIEEYEHIAADSPTTLGRMIYAEVFDIDAAMIS
jgi:hypothetical protein